MIPNKTKCKGANNNGNCGGKNYHAVPCDQEARRVPRDDDVIEYNCDTCGWNMREGFLHHIQSNFTATLPLGWENPKPKGDVFGRFKKRYEEYKRRRELAEARYWDAIRLNN